MTTTAAPVNDLANSVLPPSLFNIQYPNCRTGMFSLREPFKDMKSEPLPSETQKATSAVVQPTHLNTNQMPPIEEKPIQPISSRQKSKRNAEVQCSLLTPNSRQDMAIQTRIDRQRDPVHYVYDEYDVSPRYYRHKRLQPVEQYEKIYEVWDAESPLPVRAVPINQTMRGREVPRARHGRHRKPIIEYPDDEEVESDYDEERIVYARQPRRTMKKTYLPSNVRMICVRDDANRVSY